jgi:hypothetical protein
VKKKKHSPKSGWKNRKKQIELKLTPSAEAWIAFQDANLLPLEEYINPNQKWKSKCLQCGEIVEPRIADVKYGRRGCKVCAIKNVMGQNNKNYAKQEKKALSIAKKQNLNPKNLIKMYEQNGNANA